MYFKSVNKIKHPIKGIEIDGHIVYLCKLCGYKKVESIETGEVEIHNENPDVLHSGGCINVDVIKDHLETN